MKILVCGYFGYNESILEGQRVKTRNFFNVVKMIGSSSFVDTAKQKDSLLKVVFEVLIKSVKSDIIFILPGQNGLMFYFPIVFFIGKIFKKKIFYPVVGGWLYSVLKKKPIINFLVKRINGVLVESHQMAIELADLGLKNTVYLPNFRDINLDSREISFPNGNKIVFISRVDEKKGIFLLIQAIKELRTGGRFFHLDIFGPIAPKDEKRLFSEIENDSWIQYRGMLNQEEICSTLQDYDVFAFPTFYPGECFPGVFMDAMIAGVPVLASDWRFNSEYIIDGKNGLIFKANDVESLKEIICKYFSMDWEKRNDLRKASFDSADQYSYEAASVILRNLLMKGN